MLISMVFKLGPFKELEKRESRFLRSEDVPSDVIIVLQIDLNSLP